VPEQITLIIIIMEFVTDLINKVTLLLLYQPSATCKHCCLFVFQCVQEHRRIRGEYEARLRELEAERQMVEEDLAQVDK
jgi:hypothetical protein